MNRAPNSQTVDELLDQIDNLNRYGCVGPEGDYDAGMEAGAGDYVDGEQVRDIVAKIRLALPDGPADAVESPQYIPSRKTRNRIAALQKRADHLGARISTSQIKDLSFDKQERGALLWAIGLLNAAPQGVGSAGDATAGLPASHDRATQPARAASEAGKDDAIKCSRCDQVGSEWSGCQDPLCPAEYEQEQADKAALDEAKDAALWRDLTLLHPMDMAMIFSGAPNNKVLLQTLADFIERKRK